MEDSNWINWTDLRGGRNGVDDPHVIPADQVQEAQNIDYAYGTLGRKRPGAASVSTTGGTAFGSGLKAGIRHTPSESETGAEAFVFDGAGLVKRLAAGTSWANVTLKDAISGSHTQIFGASFNAKMVVAYDSAVNRGHVWDGSTIRRMGLAPSASAPVSGTGLSAGAVTDSRKYRIRWTVQSSGVTVRRSEPSPESAIITMAAQQINMAAPTAPGEGETHWEVFAASVSDSYATWHLIQTIVVATTSFSDNNATLYAFEIDNDLIGTYMLPPSFKYVIADDARIVMAGAWETTTAYGQTPPRNNRIWWTPVLGDQDVSDDERIPYTSVQKNFLDVTDPIVGLGGILFGSYYVFAYSKIWRFSPTGNVTEPYRRIQVGFNVGALNQQGIVMAEDENGQQALYLGSRRGIYRIGVGGLEFCGWDVGDVWDTINLAATVPIHGVYHSDLHQVWFYVAVNSDTLPTTKLVLDVRRTQRTQDRGVIKGWARHGGVSCNAAFSFMFSNTLGTLMSLDLKPYVGLSSGTTLLKADIGTTDNGTPYEAFIQKTIYPRTGAKFGIGPSYIMAGTAGSPSIHMSMEPDFGAKPSQTATASMAPDSGEETAFREFQDGTLDDIDASVTLKIGDPDDADNTWTLSQFRAETRGLEGL